MRAISDNALKEAGLYLRTLARHAPAHGLLDVRYRVRGDQLARLFLGIGTADHASRLLLHIGEGTDLYVGCAPRLRRRGTRADLAPAALLWADCDHPASLAALRAFPLEPSMVIASGSGDNIHAYWALTRPLVLGEVERGNLRLAAALGADTRCADATRILRLPGTRNFKHDPSRPVRLLHWTDRCHAPADILGVLPAASGRRAWDARFQDGSKARVDPLLRLTPARYVEVLLGRRVPNSRKIHCPFHADRIPSFHVYPSPAEGWTCFGCAGSDGGPLGGDIYTLASLLWDIPARGPDFLRLRSRLDTTFGVERG
jgi:hypothetical protein